jgi:putative SOS response-associated peptidase YedK
MCGRYRLLRRKQLVEEYFDSAPWDEDWSPGYNIAPTQSVPVIRQNPKERARELSLMDGDNSFFGRIVLKTVLP